MNEWLNEWLMSSIMSDCVCVSLSSVKEWVSIEEYLHMTLVIIVEHTEYLHMNVYIHCVIYYTCSVCVHVQVRLHVGYGHNEICMYMYTLILVWILTCIYTAAHLNFNCFSLSPLFLLVSFLLLPLSCWYRELSTIENSVEVASSVDIKQKLEHESVRERESVEGTERLQCICTFILWAYAYYHSNLWCGKVLIKDGF